jgi:hypothetical protein
VSQVFATERIENGYHRGDHAGDDRLVNFFGTDITFGKKIRGKDVKLIFCCPSFRSYPPVLNKMPAVVNTDYRVGISNIDNKKHN